MNRLVRPAVATQRSARGVHPGRSGESLFVKVDFVEWLDDSQFSQPAKRRILVSVGSATARGSLPSVLMRDQQRSLRPVRKAADSVIPRNRVVDKVCAGGQALKTTGTAGASRHHLTRTRACVNTSGRRVSRGAPLASATPRPPKGFSPRKPTRLVRGPGARAANPLHRLTPLKDSELGRSAQVLELFVFFRSCANSAYRRPNGNAQRVI